ncbi:hypothetical protein POM88_002437 [Heracleum sosnowskyi]|uniref:PPC domain-containing protein n=1 Tax=Heracleum sosnowskyi TaxID=360622 RepID=A0AAD8JED7_9APIA|nr:hypothetical protein POM88_002437 [Heracleum sosnowskyi]
MENSRKSIPSSSTYIFEENHEDVKPSLLPHQNPTITSPVSFNVPSLIHTPTFLAPMTHGGARYLINSDGGIGSNTVGLNDTNPHFTEKPFILEIANGSDVISCVTQFAQRYQVPVTVLCGHGLISEVDFTFPGALTHHTFLIGCYQIISFTGTYNCLNVPPPADIISCFTVSLTDAQGIFVGGLVASTMKAASTVKLVVCITNDLS